jgi:uncharacterized protein (DUF433 family)
MDALSQVEGLLPSLSRAEKAQLLKMVAQELGDAFLGIESKPGVCGGDPCIVRTRIPVWTLERFRQLGSSEKTVLEAYPSLRAEDLTNAWAYVRSHRAEIEEQVRLNEEA